MLRLNIKPDHPQPRHIARACEVLRAGGLVIYPTDTTYGLGCDLYAKRAIDRIYYLRGLDRKRRLSFLCSDLSQVSHYAVVEDLTYRILRHHVPGPYTFILPATREVPRVMQSNTQTVGIRVPESPVCQALLAELGHPIVNTTATKEQDGEGSSSNDPDEITRLFGRSVEVLLDGGPRTGDHSSVIDLCGPAPVIVRRGGGDLSWLGDA